MAVSYKPPKMYLVPNMVIQHFQRNPIMDFRFLGRRACRSEDNTLSTTHPAFERPSLDTSITGAPPIPFGHNAPSPFGPLITPVAIDTSDNGDELRHVRRTRSKSECLFLARNHSKNELPGPCQDYITQIQTIMAKNDPNRGSRGSTTVSPSSGGTTPTGVDVPSRRNSITPTHSVPRTNSGPIRRNSISSLPEQFST